MFAACVVLWGLQVRAQVIYTRRDTRREEEEEEEREEGAGHLKLMVVM